MRKARMAAAVLVPGVLLGTAGVIALRVHESLKAITAEVRDEDTISFDTVSLCGPGGAYAKENGSGFVPVAAGGAYTTGAVLDGRVYLAGPDGLAFFSGADEEPKRLRPGMDLPAAPITRLAVARLRGQTERSLVAATSGAGMLLIPAGFGCGVQVLPRDAAARDVTTVLPLRSGDLLLGTQSAGLLVYDGRSLKRFLPAVKDAITALAGDDADLWVGTQDAGVLHWRGGQVTRFRGDSGLPDARVNDIAVGRDAVFAATPLGVAEFADGQLVATLGKGVFARTIAVAGGHLIAATVDQGVREIALDGRLEHVALERTDLQVTGLFRAAEDVFATGDDGSVLRRTQEHAWERVIAPGGGALADREVTSLEFGPDGRLWIGYFDRGADVLDLRSGRAEHVEDDHVFCVNRIVRDPQRMTIDVATANGLVLLDAAGARPRVRQVLLKRDGLISDQVTDVAFSRSGAVVATPAGLTFLTPDGAQSLYAFQGLVNNHVYSLATDAQTGRVVAGTLGGISVVEDGTVRASLTLKNSGLKRNWVTAVVKVQEPDAESWFVGTYGGGVMQMESAGHVSAMDTGVPNTVINPNAMLVTAEHVYAGTLSDGMLVYSRTMRQWSRVTAGLPSRNVTAFAEREGELYVGTDNGLVHVAERNLR